MTNKEAHEKAAGMSLDNLFFVINKIDPNEEFNPQLNRKPKAN